MPDQRTYKVSNFNPNDFAQQVANLYQSENLEVQVVESATGVMIQSRAREFFKKASVALTITATVQNDLVTIQSGNAKWAMNAVSSVAALIVFWPLLGLTAYTSYKQKQLIDETWQLVDRYMLSIGAAPAMAPMVTQAFASPNAPVPETHSELPETNCPSCGNPVLPKSKFCGNCGKPIEAASCTKCGAPLHPNEKFCNACGTAV